MDPLETFAEEVFDCVPINFEILKNSFDLSKFNFAAQNKFYSSCPIKLIFVFILYNRGDIMSNKVVVGVVLNTGYPVRITLAAELAHVVVAELGGNVTTLLVL